MPRRGELEELLDALVRVPWWVGVGLAPVAFFGLPALGELASPRCISARTTPSRSCRGSPEWFFPEGSSISRHPEPRRPNTIGTA